MSEGHNLLSLPLSQMYKIVGRIVDNGMNQYPIIKKYYEQSLSQKAKSLKSLKTKLPSIKKRNYLDDEANIHKHIPGPGQYNIEPIMVKVVAPFKNNKQVQKKTYLDQIIRLNQRNKTPGPGNYYPNNTLQLKNESLSKHKSKKNNPQRQNYLTQAEYSASKLPGVGQYDVRQIIKTDFNRRHTSPIQQRKKHKKRVMSQKKLKPFPDIGTYDPLPSSYRVFSAMNSQKPKKNGFGKVQRFKTLNDGSGLSPDKYGNIHQWVKNKLKHSYQRNGMDFLTKGNNKNVYY